jgi:oligopeptide/dipeptide ABC transporter ATP-binding protein
MGSLGLNNALVEIKGLKKFFEIKKGFFGEKALVKAVDDVDLTISKQETVGLVGESGCGKTTLGRLILRLIEPTEGTVLFEGRNLCSCHKQELRSVRRFIQAIFQDPFSSLNPRMSVGTIIGRNMKAQGFKLDFGYDRYIKGLLESVGLRPEFADRYPHEFSGGQRQRIAVARAIATRPKLIIADEPTSALDVSVQAQILNLLMELQRSHEITFLFISHNIHVVKHMSQRVGVMYLGKIVEIAPKERLFNNPMHPYTRALLGSMLEPKPTQRKEEAPLKGEVPSPINPPDGCRFHPRCNFKKEDCTIEPPGLVEVEADHYVACHFG